MEEIVKIETVNDCCCMSCSPVKLNSEIKYCKGCGVVLTNDNWHSSRQKSGTKICKPCFSTSEKIARLQPKRKLARAQKVLEIKTKLFDLLGNKCECCGFDNMVALALDHINGKGGEHRKDINNKGGWKYYDYVLKNLDDIELMNNLRILCYNCNQCHSNFGYCAHKETKERQVKKSLWIYDKEHCCICGLFLTDNNQYAQNRYGTNNRSKKNICKYCIRENANNMAFQKKIEVVNNYGGCCAHCGEIIVEFLAVDHIFNDGSIERREKGLEGKDMYYWLLRNRCPKDRYQILCHNCNYIKQYNKISIIEQVKHGELIV